MRLDSFVTHSRITEIRSRDLPGAIRELLSTCDIPEIEKGGKEKILKELLERERTITTNLGNGVALPHMRLPMKRRLFLAVGRCPGGLTHEGKDDYADVRIIILLLAAEHTRNYLNILAQIAQTFQNPSTTRDLMIPADPDDFKRQVKSLFRGEGTKPRLKPTRINRLILRSADRIARGAHCSAILVFGDTFAGGVELDETFKDTRTILVTQGGSESAEDIPGVSDVLAIRSFSHHRLSQLRPAILIGLTRGIFKPEDQICCVGGLPQSNRFDTVLVVDIAHEFQSLISDRIYNVTGAVRPEVLERVLAIATELGTEGREGRKVGCLFVLGDTQRVIEFVKPLVLNPFYGYKEEDRNVLNPFMDETVKELSSIDGAFIIRGNGVIESAGSLLRAPEIPDKLPSGLGSRHAAAAAITKSTKAVAVVVSSSNGQVTLFSRGEMFPLLGRPLGGNF